MERSKLQYLLTPDQIRETCARFEEMYKNWQESGMDKNRAYVCAICKSDKRQQINEMLLRNATSTTIARVFPCSQKVIHRHFQDHLMLAIEAGMLIGSIKSKAEQLNSEQFPMRAPAKRQLVWCLAQLAALKEYESDLLFRRMAAFKRMDTNTVERLILKMRETILMVDRLRTTRKGSAGQAPKDYGDVNDWLTDQQKAEMQKLDDMEQAKAKRTLERMIKDATSGNGANGNDKAGKRHQASEDGSEGDAPVVDDG